MNVTYLAAYTVIPSRSANSVQVMNMCAAYARLGHRVTLVVPRHSIEPDLVGEDPWVFYGLEKVFGIRRVPLPPWRTDTLYFGFLLPLVALATRPHLVHSRSLAPAWGATHLIRRPTLYETHSIPSDNIQQQRLFTGLLSSRHLVGLVSITQALADQLRHRVPESTRMIVAPDGVARAVLEEKLSSGEARARLRIPDNGRRIATYAGHLYRGRGIEIIVELARLLPDHLFMVVGGNDEDVAYWKSRSKGLLNLCFTGFRPPAEVRLWLAAADALLMPYTERVEVAGGGNTASIASPLKMFEYMASGRPILASTLPVLQEVLREGENALLIPHNRPESWADNLRRLAREPELGAALGAKARTQAAQYTWENRASRILEGFFGPPQ